MINNSQFPVTTVIQKGHDNDAQQLVNHPNDSKTTVKEHIEVPLRRAKTERKSAS